MSGPEDINEAGSPVLVTLELVTSLRPALGGNGADLAVQASVERQISQLLSALGLDCRAAATVEWVPEGHLPAERFLRLRINGELCRYPDDLLQDVQGWAAGRWPDPEAATAPKVLEWLQVLAQRDPARAMECVATVCAEIVKRRPEALLGPRQAPDLARAVAELADRAQPLPEPWPPEPQALRATLRSLLELRISLGDRATIARTLQSALSAGRPLDEISELLIDVLRPQTVGLLLPWHHLQQLTSDGAGPRDLFALLREKLFERLGVTYPPFHFEIREDLEPTSFAIRINHLTTLPTVGLGPEQYLVNDTQARVAQIAPKNTLCERAVNPDTRRAETVVSSVPKAVFEEAGVTTPLQYLILCLDDALTRAGACFVDRGFTRRRLDEWATESPMLVAAVRGHFSDERVTRVLRVMSAEQISLRNFRAILESMLDCDAASTPETVVETVRGALQRHLAVKYARETDTIVVYLADRRIEELAGRRRPGALGSDEGQEKEDDDILRALRSELDILRSRAPTAHAPHLLTTPDARRSLRDIVATEFPRLAVISHAELPSQTNIQPVARISLPAMTAVRGP